MKENTEKAILKNWESDKKARRDERTKKEEEAKKPLKSMFEKSPDKKRPGL